MYIHIYIYICTYTCIALNHTYVCALERTRSRRTVLCASASPYLDACTYKLCPPTAARMARNSYSSWTSTSCWSSTSIWQHPLLHDACSSVIVQIIQSAFRSLIRINCSTRIVQSPIDFNDPCSVFLWILCLYFITHNLIITCWLLYSINTYINHYVSTIDINSGVQGCGVWGFCVW